MISHFDLDLAHYRLLAEEWRWWKTQLAQVDALTLPKGHRSLVVASQRQGTWELAIASTAYAQLGLPSTANTDPGSDEVTRIVGALGTLSGRNKFPNFVELAGEVTTLPLGTLIRNAPRLGAILRKSGPLTAMAIGRADYCLRRYPNDPEGFRRCLREG